MIAPVPLGPLLRAFFADHLMQQRSVSPQTINAYRDAFRLLLTFLDQHRQRKPDALTLDDLDAPVILAFLDHLEKNRANSVQSRNARLTAIRSFVRFAALRTPESLDLTSRVLAIPRKRAPRRQVHYLTRLEMDAILAGCDRSTHGGRRDHVLLLTLYNTGARVSELVALRRSHVRFGAATMVQLFGKGRKERAVPLWTRTSRSLRQWFDEEGEATPDYAFRNARGDRLTRQGVTHLLDQACQRARQRYPSLAAKRVSPHIVRHTTAMHLLQAGVDMATIALWLGHERLETTHHYIEADLQLKERALRKLEPLGQRTQRFKADASLLTFLYGAPGFLGHGLRENPMSKEVGGMVGSKRVKGAVSARTEGARRASGVGADGAAVGAGALAPGQRWSASRKRDVVLRLLRGESLDTVSREVGVELYRLEAWQARALAGLELGLKAQAGEPLAAELDAAKRHIGELSMEIELLRERARAAECRLPLATRRSRR